MIAQRFSQNQWEKEITHIEKM